MKRASVLLLISLSFLTFSYLLPAEQPSAGKVPSLHTLDVCHVSGADFSSAFEDEFVNEIQYAFVSPDFSKPLVSSIPMNSLFLSASQKYRPPKT